MLIRYDVAQINQVLCDFFNATDVRVDLFDNSFSPISHSENAICCYCHRIQQCADRKKTCVEFDVALLTRSCNTLRMEQDTCPFGLLNAVSPILYHDAVIGYLFFGQMRSNDAPPPEMCAFAEAYAQLPLFCEDRIHSISKLAEILMGYILTANMLRPDSGEILQRVDAFIDAHLGDDLSIKTIAKQVNVSKSVLYSKFHAQFHCTVGEYVNRKRVERAMALLTETTRSVEDISQQCGFSSASYFTKIFKQHTGTTPLKFRKSVAF